MSGRDRRRVRGVVLAAAGLIAVVVASVVLPNPTARGATPGGEPQVITGLDYGATGDPGNLLDAYIPQDGEPTHPAIVLVHGGGWTGGNRARIRPDAQAMAEQGFAAFTIAYDLTEKSKWPTEVEDVQQAVRWVQDNAATYHVDPTRIGLFGSSAGGNLVMLVGTYGLAAPGRHTGATQPPNRPPVRAVASWSGPSDVTTIAPTNESDQALGRPSKVPIPGEVAPPGCQGDVACIGLIGPPYLESYMGGCNIDECESKYLDASPVFHVTSTTPPMYLAGATEDLVPLEQNFEMSDALVTHGITSRLQIVAGLGHAESYRELALQPTIDFFTAFVTDGQDPTVATSATPTTIAGSAALPALVDGNLLPAPNLSKLAPPPTTEPAPTTAPVTTPATVPPSSSAVASTSDPTNAADAVAAPTVSAPDGQRTGAPSLLVPVLLLVALILSVISVIVIVRRRQAKLPPAHG